ncbi:MAG: molecular chaperone HtpG [Candidatus Lokiarchaeota archaeon]|nr:molecular chaperone HtpG [Candidatus Lokiarchaeota archaeon]
MSKNKYEFKAEIKKLLDILSKSLYQHKEVFLRELISNSVDALKKIHFLSLTDKNIEDIEDNLKIEIIIDSDSKTITVKDTGIGMNKEELINNLGTIAGSGSQKFLEQLNNTQKIDNKNVDLDVIGQFGVGFYSIFMVADKVKVISKSYIKEENAYEWESDGTGEFIVNNNDKSTRGTDVILFLKEDEKEYLDKFRIESIIKKYSNYVSFPIYVSEIKKEAEEEKEKKVEEVEDKKKPEPINELTPLWKKNSKDITEEEYKSFYHFISNRYDNYSHVINYSIDGTVQFRSILFIPESDINQFIRPDDEYGLTLYSKNVMIMKNCSDLIPKWMRFIKGVVDSNDIPLNISRDTIQTNRVMMKIEKLLIKKILRELDNIAENEPEKYKKLWESFSPYIKEGILSDAFRTDKLLTYLRFNSSKSKEGEYRSIEDYIKDMPETQKELYYLIGENLNTLKLSPHLGYYNENNMEVILLDEPIDNFLMMNVREYKKTILEGENEEIKSYTFTPIDVTEPTKEDKEASEDEGKKDKTEELIPENIKKFFEYVKSTLGEKILEVKLSDRLYQNVCRLANPAGGMTSSMQRAMRYWTKTEYGKDFEIPRKILEFNKDHPIFNKLIELYENDPKDDKVTLIITQLFENCLLAEGDLPNPSLMVPRINQLIELLLVEKK